MDNGLLLASCTLSYQNTSALINNVLIDTGCAVSIFDIDLMEAMGLKPDCNSARIVRMYGVGGGSEACIEQEVHNLCIDNHICRQFRIQLGPIQSEYGFEAILGNDFMLACGLTIDLRQLTVLQHHARDVLFLN